MQSFLEGVVNIELKTGRICNELLEALKEGNVFLSVTEIFIRIRKRNRFRSVRFVEKN